MIKIGLINSIDLDNRLITIKMRNKTEYFYLQNGLLKKFQRYLSDGIFIEFDYTDQAGIYNNVCAYKINYFIRIFSNKRFRREVYYDLQVIRSGVKDLLFNQKNIMFLDLEMTMQSFDSPKDFKSEIIQAGYLITDNLGNDLERKSYYIKPTLFPKINKRTLKFLSLNEEDIDNGISFVDFYNEFSETLKKYNNPSIVVWGKNDILALKLCYEINNVEPLNPNFINLLQIHKNYYNLKNDLGLFDAYKKYTGSDLFQEHDALEDAFMTKNVFFEFKKEATR
ncbi:MAG: hypothetical protein J6Y28_03460 [Acholeplasmatales bacterium]|nr:hypothetical protein [Acholeplasmatales bacterium]